MDQSFASLMLEAAGDVETLHILTSETWRIYTQVKDFIVTPSLFKPVLQEFRRRHESAGQAFRGFRLVARGFVGKLAGVVEGIGRLKETTPFYQQGGTTLLDATKAELESRGARCGLSPDDISFLLENVEFDELSGLHKVKDAKRLFKSALGEMDSTATESGRKNAYNACYELIRNGTGRQITREEIESTLRTALQQTTLVSETTDRTPTLGTGARITDLMTPLARMHDLVDDHPFWHIGIGVSSRGERAVSLSPRSPDALVNAPLKLQVEPYLHGSVTDLRDLVKRLYASGDPIEFYTKKISATLGEREIFSAATGTMEISLPADVLHDTVTKCHVTSASGDRYEYVIHLSARTYEGTTYADNRSQAQSPVEVCLQINQNPDGRTAAGDITFALTQAGHRRARHQLKFLQFLHTVAIENQPIVLATVDDEVSAPLQGHLMLPDLDRETLESAMVTWQRVVELERHLGVTLEVPHVISKEEQMTALRLWELLIRGEAVTETPPIRIHVKSSPVKHRELLDIVEKNTLLVLTGTVPSETVDLWGITVELPERTVSIRPLQIKNRRAVQRALATRSGHVNLVFESKTAVTLTEQNTVVDLATE